MKDYKLILQGRKVTQVLVRVLWDATVGFLPKKAKEKDKK